MNYPTSLVILQLLALFVSLYANLRFTEKIGKGRILSRPLWRFRLFAPLVFFDRVYAVRTRAAQLTILLAWSLSMLVMVASGIDFPLALSAAWNIIFICLYLDDYMTGDDERWQRFREGVRRLLKAAQRTPQTEGA